MVKYGEKMVKFYLNIYNMLLKWWKNGEILFFLKNGEMVKNGDLNFKILFT